MDEEGVPDANAPRPIILRYVDPVSNIPSDVDPAPIFLGDVDSVEEALEPKQDNVILGFASGFVIPPAFLVFSLWLLNSSDGQSTLSEDFLVMCSGYCIWPIASIIIIKAKNDMPRYTAKQIGAIFSLMIWLLIFMFAFLLW